MHPLCHCRAVSLKREEIPSVGRRALPLTFAATLPAPSTAGFGPSTTISAATRRCLPGRPSKLEDCKVSKVGKGLGPVVVKTWRTKACLLASFPWMRWEFSSNSPPLAAATRPAAGTITWASMNASYCTCRSPVTSWSLVYPGCAHGPLFGHVV